ncbi:LOW QUALITY PROTEIN: hypothetical protein U9M48_005646 [Paspalum notatum var. saurae]|uniref:Uncharacterized protein n=1 Tax=Paspalum notatum var. saurae TaxID=547442 RepID=A0AAQ3PSN4_PASNO
MLLSLATLWKVDLSISSIINYLDLAYVDVSDNTLTGAIPEGLCARGHFVILTADNNRFHGSIPLTSAIPEGLCDRGQFIYLTADNNRFNGSIPESLANCVTLQGLSFNDNQLTGAILEGLCSAEGGLFVSLTADNNRLNGLSSFLPSYIDILVYFLTSICDINQLTYLDLSDNNISSAFPTTLYHCVSIEYLDLSQNNLTAADMGQSIEESLTTLKINYHRFSGTIPSDLGSLKRLQTLWLANNPFDAGELPASFKNLANLVSLWAVTATSSESSQA